MPTVTPFLVFNGNLQEALDFYRSVFPDSRVVDTHPGPDGSLFGATFELAGQRFMGLNTGPDQGFTPNVSFYVSCETQEEVDTLWNRLLAGGGREDGCGWLRDRFGLSWQIIPSALPRLLFHPDREQAGRALQAMLGMTKIDISGLERAAAGS